MVINLFETKELIFYNPRTRLHFDLPAMSTIEPHQLNFIYVQNNFKCDIHFKHIMTVSSQRLHILKVLSLSLLAKLLMVSPLGIVS